MKMKISAATLIIVILLIVSCRKKADVGNENSSSLDLPETPYEYTKGDDNVVTLGRVLFYDKSLSLNNSVACGSCHQQARAFCDNQQFSTGLQDGKTRRNTPGIFAHQGNFFWDGRAGNLNSLVLMPVKNHVEMNFGNIDALIERISKTEYYPELFKKAFNTTSIDSIRLKTALTAFVNNFNFSSNKFNRNLLEMEKLNASESLGKTIFFGKGRCSRCHHIVDPNPGSGGGYGSTPSLPKNKFNIGLDNVYADNGVGEVSGSIHDQGKFIVPILLNIEYTAPYMHDGRYKTLAEVIEHYNSGIYNHTNLSVELRDLGIYESLTEQQQLEMFDSNKNSEIEGSEVAQYPPVKLNLTTAEKASLVDFLKTLSDPTIFSEKKFSNPFK
jgi:cytochrome c peroxidase